MNVAADVGAVTLYFRFHRLFVFRFIADVELVQAVAEKFSREYLVSERHTPSRKVSLLRGLRGWRWL